MRAWLKWMAIVAGILVLVPIVLAVEDGVAVSFRMPPAVERATQLADHAQRLAVLGLAAGLPLAVVYARDALRLRRVGLCNEL